MIACAPQVSAHQWFTPPQIARLRGVKPSKVVAWIRSGELLAVNHAGKCTGRPRWRVSQQALEMFDAARSCRAHISPTAPLRRVKSPPGVIEFF